MRISYHELCRNWGIDPMEHVEIFEWLKEDPRDEQGRLTREIGINKHGGTPEKLVRKHSMAGTGFYRIKEDSELYPRFTGKVSVNMLDFCWKKSHEN